MTLRLPLRILQALARTGDTKTTAEISTAVSIWNELEGGRIARDAAWHAGQILAIVNLGKSTSNGEGDGGSCKPLDLPIEPMAVFYATLVLLAFVRGLDKSVNGRANATSTTTALHTSAMNGSSSPSSTTNSTSTITSLPESVKLDQILHRTDPTLMKWITSGEGTISLDPSLGGDLRSHGFSYKLLKVVGEWLKELKVWRVGELLGISIDESILSGKSLFGTFEV